MAQAKGISPVVAAVLLIAIAVAIGIMVSTWVTHWVSTQVGSTSISCAVDTRYVIDSARFGISGFNSTLLIKITNHDDTKLYGFGVVLDNGTRTIQFNSTQNSKVNQGGINASNRLLRGQSVYIKVYLNGTGEESFGNSLKTSSNTKKVRLTNDACPSVWAETDTVN